jgi:hypothetical protein
MFINCLTLFSCYNMKRYNSFNSESGDLQCLSQRFSRDYAEDPTLSPVPEEVSFLDFHLLLSMMKLINITMLIIFNMNARVLCSQG